MYLTALEGGREKEETRPFNIVAAVVLVDIVATIDIVEAFDTVAL